MVEHTGIVVVADVAVCGRADGVAQIGDVLLAAAYVVDAGHYHERSRWHCHFRQLPFDAAGTYEYTLVQVAGNADGVTYDSTEYAATITVTATADNTLTAAVSYAKDGETVDAATFANVYKAPTKPGEPTQPAEPVS